MCFGCKVLNDCVAICSQYLDCLSLILPHGNFINHNALRTDGLNFRCCTSNRWIWYIGGPSQRLVERCTLLKYYWNYFIQPHRLILSILTCTRVCLRLRTCTCRCGVVTSASGFTVTSVHEWASSKSWSQFPSMIRWNRRYEFETNNDRVKENGATHRNTKRRQKCISIRCGASFLQLSPSYISVTGRNFIHKRGGPRAHKVRERVHVGERAFIRASSCFPKRFVRASRAITRCRGPVLRGPN